MSAIAAAHPPPTDSLATSLRRKVLLTVLTSVLMYGVAEQDVALTLTLLVAAIAGWLYTETGTRRGVPRWATGLVLLGILAGAVVRSLHGVPMVSAFSTFLASIVVLKLWERREPRDYGQLFSLCVFLVIGAALTATSLWLGLGLLVMMPLLASGVMTYQVFAARARAQARSHAFPHPPDNPLRGIVPMTLFTLVVGTIIAVAVFVLVPRGEGYQRLLAMRGPAVGRQTGFTDRVDLDQGGLVTESQATVMEVGIYAEGADQPLGSSYQTHYLRGLVLDTYERGVWHSNNLDDVLRRRVRHERQPYQVADTDPSREVIVQHVVPRVPATTFAPVFGLTRTLSASFHRLPAKDGEFGKVDLLVDERTGTLMYMVPPGSQAWYRVRSQAGEVWSEAAWTRNDVRGESSQLVRELAERILGDAGLDPDPETRPTSEDAAAARALESYLRSRYQYTLESASPPKNREPTEWFLFTTRRGHCEHFASALAVLCRSVGIEARLAAGYLVNEFNPTKGVYTVRAADAHAWVEVRTGADGWRTFDATPPSELSRLHEQRRGIAGTLGRWLDSMESTWNSRVATFDAVAQARLLGRRQGERAWNAALSDRIRRIMSKARGEEDRPPSASALLWKTLWALLSFLAAGFGAWALLRQVKSTRGPRAWGLTPRAAALHAAVERALEPALGKRPAWQPLKAWASTAGPEAADLADIVYRWGFGDDAPHPSDVKRARMLVQSLAALSRARAGRM